MIVLERRWREIMFFDREYEDLKNFAEDLFDHPELGFKEERTQGKVIDYIHSVNPQAKIETFALTGLRVDLNHNCQHTMAFLAELDAVYTPNHFRANPQTGAAHTCGHFSQVTIALALYHYFFVTQAYQQLDFNLAFIFVPAEEYLDLDYRRSLRDQGKVVHLGGKAEAMRLGVFNDIDFAIHIHSIGERFHEPTIELACDLAGFCYKYFDFQGRASHAGFDPYSGVNAYSMSTLFNTAIGLARQQMREDVYLRLNPIIMDASSMSTNVIPDQVRVGTDIRSMSLDYMREVSQRLDQMAQGSALALGGQVTCETEMGYLPFHQDDYLTQLAKEAFMAYPAITGLIDQRGAIAAAGDIGDLSYMLPCIQISYGGFEGRIHGIDFRMIDPEFVLKTFPDYLVQCIHHISDSMDYNKLYRRSYSDYLSTLTTML